MPPSRFQALRDIPGITLLCISFLAMACASQQSVPASSGRPANQPASAPSGSAPKTLVVGQSFDMAGLNRVGRNDAEVGHVMNAGLVTRDSEKYELLPWMAEALPTLDGGTWRVNPDGTMVTTWRLKPNIKWHDGTAFKTSDFVFGWQVFTDPRM